MILKTRLVDILALSLRPTQLLLALAAFVMVTVILYNHFVVGGQYFSVVSDWLVVSLFIVYSAASLYCCLVVDRAKHDAIIRYSSAIIGVLAWSLVFASNLLTRDVDSIVTYLIPIAAEAWAIAQLTSGVRELDRRAL